MPWTAPEPDRVEGPTTGAERPLLTGYLTWQRTGLLNVCAGLTGEQLCERAVPPSDLSLLGLVRHMAKVDRIWFRQRVASEDVPPLFVPGSADFTDTDPARAANDIAALQDEWRAADAAVESVDLDYEIDVSGEALSLRMIYLHVIHEYARHTGHADLLRERLDGITGR